ncbi:hypothetical protein O7635_02845 [Asanoa sp. WMMD1127]|uniref:hypothetical protein n=1 Tax=Asanoa sp. WMMD1127 TaxID=3016107 RepID=UPI0024180F20|nr:hypothetical protein [Asanoa sp. WMMD1127]MDG4820789.1 hypothetical protein [Asanoa sp. WMMD1127]
MPFRVRVAALLRRGWAHVVDGLTWVGHSAYTVPDWPERAEPPSGDPDPVPLTPDEQAAWEQLSRRAARR